MVINRNLLIRLESRGQDLPDHGRPHNIAVSNSTQRRHCNREVVATRRGPYPHTDGGVEVRRVFHQLRSHAIEPFKGFFKNIFAWGGHMPVKGLRRCQLLALGAVLLYQVVLLYQHQHHYPVGVGIKALLRAA